MQACPTLRNERIDTYFIKHSFSDRMSRQFFLMPQTQRPVSPSARGRLALEDTTNGSRSPTPSPPLPTAKTGPVLRHRASQRALHPHLDSSESYPSPAGSIYQASAADVSTEKFNWYDTRAWATPTKAERDDSPWKTNEVPSWEDTVVDANGNNVPSSFLQDTPSPKKHQPHKLYPITEQNSLATLRPGTSSSTLKGKRSSASVRPLSPGLKGKKRKSFSLSDLPLSPQPPPISKDPSPPPTPLPAPIEPHKSPPVRIPTPPGLPTFNVPQTNNYRLPPPPGRFRDRFLPPTAAEREWAQQTVGLPRGVVMRGENGVVVRSKFTPIRSGHLPPQRQAHGFMRVREPTHENAEGSGPARPVVPDLRRVHFTGPQSTTGEGDVHPWRTEVTRIDESTQGDNGETVLKKFYWIIGCCGLCEELERKAKTKNRLRRLRAQQTPLFVGGRNASPHMV